MFIHIGNNVLVSSSNCVGIFNIDTLKLSEDNKWMFEHISEKDRMISIDMDNKITASELSSYTIIKRIPFSEDELLWSKK